MRSLLAAVVLLAAVATAAGCGASPDAGADPASLAPAGARVLAEIDGDLDSAQWRAARELVGRFPDGDKLLDKLDDFKDAAGDQVVVVATNDMQAVALTQPRDSGKLRSLVADHHLVSREISGWTAVAADAAALDAYERALDGGTLDGDARYRAARSELPDDALATVFARAEAAADWTAFALTAEEDGFRLAGHLRVASASARPALDPVLLDEVPGDALAVLALGGGGLPAELPNPLGIDLTPIADLLSGGAVLWVRPGAPIPEITAILPKADAADLDQLVRSLTGSMPEDAQLDGRPAKRIMLGPVGVTYADVDGRLVLTTGGSLRTGGGFADQAGFREARDKAGLTGATGGFIYVDVTQVASFLGILGGLGQMPQELARNLAHVRWLYAGYGGDGADQEIAGFVAIG